MRVENLTNIPTEYLRRLCRWIEQTANRRTADRAFVFRQGPAFKTRVRWRRTDGHSDKIDIHREYTIYIPAIRTTDEGSRDPMAPGRTFRIVAELGWHFSEPKPPLHTEFATLRHNIIATFTERQEALMASWRSSIRPEDLPDNIRAQAKVLRARAGVVRWGAKQARATAWLKRWQRRLAAAERALAARMAKPQ